MSDNQATLDRTRTNMSERKKNIAQRLRDLADEVDRIDIARRDGSFRRPADVVGDVVHAVQWGLANLPLQSLASWAGDVYEIEALTMEEIK